MKRVFLFLLAALLLTGCGRNTDPAQVQQDYVSGSPGQQDYVSGFPGQTVILLSDEGVSWDGPDADGVKLSNDIIYYEDRDVYDSGNPYGEGETKDRHTAQEAAAHTVVEITKPGAYRVSGKLSAGQIRVDLGEDAYEDPNAVVELVLDGADITCTVAPAILFLNVYECDGQWDAENAKAEVDTGAAGANLILAEGSENYISGSHVAKIFKDKEDEKKLWKQDGAVYSYMSMNVYGPGKLDITADNEGLDTELHLTINGGEIAIRSDNDGINTNEDGVSVTTINGGNLHIIAGLGKEGDGIDSNGYLVINGGTVVAAANPASDAGLDSDLGSYINGGRVIALGSSMDWAESESGQVTMNLQFAQYQSSGSAIAVTKEDGQCVFAYDPSEDEVLGENTRQFMGAIISCPDFQVGDSYQVWLDGSVTGTEQGGMYDTSAALAHTGGVRMAYTGTDVMMGGPGGPGGFGGQRPEGEEPPQLPEGETMPEGMEPPEGMMPPEGFGGGQEGGQPPQLPEGEAMPEGMEPPEGFDGEAPAMPEGETAPQPGGGFPGQPGMNGQPGGAGNSLFYMQDMVNFFSGLTAVQ